MNEKIHDRSAAISSALNVYLEPQQTARAVKLWREKYETMPTFSVQHFARECCEMFGVETLRSQIVQKLVQELNSQRMRGIGSTGKSANEESLKEAAVQTFQLLFRAITDSAGPLRGRELSRFVLDGLVRVTMSNAERKSLELWLNGNAPMIEAAVSVPVLTMLVNRAYVGLCEYCGPVKADSILHSCVNRVANTAAAEVFHPQRLL